MSSRHARSSFPTSVAVAILLAWSNAAARVPLWTELAPPPRSGHAAFFDDRQDRLVVFGKDPDSGWSLSLDGSAVWEPFRIGLPATGDLTGWSVDCASAVYDSARHRVLAIAGVSYPNDQLFSYLEVWALALDPQAHWTRLAPIHSGLPAGRGLRAYALAVDTRRDRLLLHGGYRSSLFSGNTSQSDLWAFDLSGGGDGWSQLMAAPAGDPGVFGHAAFYDAVNDRLVAFGGASVHGYNPSPRNTVLAIPLSGPTSDSSLASGSPSPTPRYDVRGAWDPVGRAFLVFGGTNTTVFGNQGYDTELWEMRFETPDSVSWTLLRASTPMTRIRSSLTWDALGSRAIVYGGESSYLGGNTWFDRSDAISCAVPGGSAWQSLSSGMDSVEPRAGSFFRDPLRDRYLLVPETAGSTHGNDLWGYDPVAVSWTRLTPQTPPPVVAYSRAVYDPPRDGIVAFITPTTGPRVWRLPLTGTLAWQSLPTSIGPSVVQGYSAVMDPAGDRLLVFGGSAPGPGGSTPTDTLWSLSFGTSPALWSPLFPPGPRPSARAHHFAAFDSAGRRMFVYAGNAAQDLWMLELGPAAGWTQIVPNAVGPYTSTGLAYDANRNRLVVTSAEPVDGVSEPATWTLDLAAPTWTRLSVGVHPRAIRGMLLADPGRDRIVEFGGTRDSRSTSELWALTEGEPPLGAPLPGPSPTLRMSAWPNPARDRLGLSIRVPDAGRVHVEAFDVTGRRVFDRTYEAPAASERSLMLETDSWRSGVVLVRATQGTRSAVTRAVVIR